VAVRIHNDIVMGMVEGDLARFPITDAGRRYQSANYETAAKRADIRVGGDNGSVEFV
jgi:hypothetical protein